VLVSVGIPAPVEIAVGNTVVRIGNEFLVATVTLDKTLEKKYNIRCM
jgi:predicted NBD/HSP70 family sugar kinase